MSMPAYIELGGIAVAKNANLTINQDYFRLGASTFPPIRMSNGDAKVQTVWGAKIRTVITANGWRSSPFDGLDLTQPLLLKCGAPKTIASAANAIALPTARRTDANFEPYGYAVVNGSDVESPVVVDSDIATVTVVPGATQYGVHYFPEITVYAQLNTSTNIGEVEFDWELEAEEI